MPELPALEHLDLGNNKFENANCLPALMAYPTLKVILFAGSPFADELGDRLKSEILVTLGTHLKQIKMVNGEEEGGEVTEDDVTAANEERSERARQK